MSLNADEAARFPPFLLLLLVGVLTDVSSGSGLAVAVLLKFFLTAAALEPRPASGVVGACVDAGDVPNSSCLICEKWSIIKSHNATAPETVSLTRRLCDVNDDDGSTHFVSLTVEVLDDDAATDRTEGNENGPTLITLPLVVVVVDALSFSADDEQDVDEASVRNVERPLAFLLLSATTRSTVRYCISVSSYQTLIS